jgi:hypothetical protein
MRIPCCRFSFELSIATARHVNERLLAALSQMRDAVHFNAWSMQTNK